MSITTGTKLGPYEILAPIRSGVRGEVWKARDTRLGRIVAIKKVREQHSERFKQEASTVGGESGNEDPVFEKGLLFHLSAFGERCHTRSRIFEPDECYTYYTACTRIQETL
jgi:serine/threonine protein kinase